MEEGKGYVAEGIAHWQCPTCCMVEIAPWQKLLSRTSHAEGSCTNPYVSEFINKNLKVLPSNFKYEFTVIYDIIYELGIIGDTSVSNSAASQEAITGAVPLTHMSVQVSIQMTLHWPWLGQLQVQSRSHSHSNQPSCWQIQRFQSEMSTQDSNSFQIASLFWTRNSNYHTLWAITMPFKKPLCILFSTDKLSIDLGKTLDMFNFFSSCLCKKAWYNSVRWMRVEKPSP